MRTLRLSLLLFGLVLSGCSTSSALNQARIEFASGSPLQALNTLENADVKKRDSLLVLLDQGAIAFSAGQYTRSKEALLKANDLINEWDQIRVSEQSASLVTNEWATRYRGEYSEQLWVHSYLMMVFLMQNNPESAAVEARRALKRIDENTSPLKIDWFTRALIGLSFEAAGAHDSAQVEYRKLVADKGYNGSWNNVIQRHSQRIGRDPIDGSTRKTSAVTGTPTQLGNDEGELIVFLQTGRIAQKLPGDLTLDIDLRIAFPYYAEFRDSRPRYSVTANGESVAADRIDTRLINVAQEALSARGTSLATKQIARVAAKRAVVEAASNEDAVLGAIIQILVFATEQADTRSWETLPGWFGMIRVPLPEGEQEVVVNLNHRGIDHRVELGTINIKRRGLHFATFRTNQPLPMRDGQSLTAPTIAPNPEPPTVSAADAPLL